MGKKGKFFCAVKRVLSPGSKEKKQSGKVELILIFDFINFINSKLFNH